MSDDLMGTSRKNNSGTDVPLPGEVIYGSGMRIDMELDSIVQQGHSPLVEYLLAAVANSTLLSSEGTLFWGHHGENYRIVTNEEYKHLDTMDSLTRELDISSMPLIDRAWDIEGGNRLVKLRFQDLKEAPLCFAHSVSFHPYNKLDPQQAATLVDTAKKLATKGLYHTSMIPDEDRNGALGWLLISGRPGEVYLDSMRGCLQIEGSTNDFLQVLTKQIKDCTV